MKMSISTAIEERTEGEDDTSQESQAKDDSDIENEVENDDNENEDHENDDNENENDENEDNDNDDNETENENDNITENENGAQTQNGGPGSPEVHEITSDDDDEDEIVLSNDDDSSNSSTNDSETPQRNNTKKTEIYNNDKMENGDDESDIEEITMEDPLDEVSSNKSKPIVINDTKNLADLAHSQPKSNDQNKEPTVVIIDTNSIMSGKESTSITQSSKSISTISNSVNSVTLCQSIAARGTTITPVSVKSNTNTNSTSNSAPPQAPILPSLTDDMFVVEAPSFIVPYVYEKPSIKPFREFVDALGKELEEVRLKEEKEKQEREQAEKERKEKEKQERRDRGEEVADSEPEDAKKGDKKRRRRKDDDDASWDGESSDESDDVMSDDDVAVVKDKEECTDEVKDLTAKPAVKSDSYFDCSLGQFFINIGANLVQEFVQTDLLKQQNRKLYKEKKSGRSTKATEAAINSLTQNLEFSKKTNAPYALDQKRCEFCSFKTESALVMAHHLEAPHMKNNIYRCNTCPFEIRSPHDILYHMESQHNLRGRLERAPAYQQCANCTFEDNSKSKLARHLIACAKKFKPHANLEPPLEWEPPAKIPKLSRARPAGAFGAAAGARGPVPPTALAGRGLLPPGVRARGRPPQPVPGIRAPAPGAPLVRSGLMIMHNAPQGINNYPPLPTSATPKISITPLPRTPHAQQQMSQPAAGKSAFVICEICDGYIKDLEQLRNHMQWIHKVKIHPKMIYNRPPLNCQKCQFRFFTDQGLERHLLGSHGLVTSSMQEAANKGKDAGRCPVCGRVYQWKLLNHVARDHGMTLKPAHLSYKCTVCTATFGMYKQFESHVYSAHSVVAKRVMDKGKAPPAAQAAPLKPIKINDEITIIPQPAKPQAASSKDK